MRIAAVIVLAAVTAMPAAAARPHRSTSCSSSSACSAPGRPIASSRPRPPIRMSASRRRARGWCWRTTISAPIMRSTATACCRRSGFPASSLSVEVIFQPGTEAEERQKLVFLVRDGTRRTMFNQPDGGAVRVKDGIALGARQQDAGAEEVRVGLERVRLHVQQFRAGELGVFLDELEARFGLGAHQPLDRLGGRLAAPCPPAPRAAACACPGPWWFPSTAPPSFRRGP